ncbi:hypothetical protein [Hymenobacter properus]|uniref:Uncharacterized protein n=1 Tax=Hymenobacter properus TaxID=2791026 RepID=A0A931BK38_9BACT|nr:hypothetical protein [Hymenobacter properus]MBF9143762.1 hypothetical protein [Hymenobacter properus]MBR7722575.1 hypothetical protein [Microvirga sp. SRT04]
MSACFVAAGLLLLAGCDQNTASLQETAAHTRRPVSVAQTAPRTLVAANTALPYLRLPGVGDSIQAPALVRINNTAYRVQVGARTDSARPLRHILPASPAADSPEADTVTGFEGYYTFRLLRADGKAQFARQLKKTSFSAAVSPDLAVEAEATPPIFSGYLPAFKALAFEINFYPPESDAGGQALLLLDAATGKVRHLALARWTGGCNSNSVLSADGRTLLTSCELLQANGHVTNLEKPGREVAGTLLVNNETALVVYAAGYDQYGEEVPLRGPNAQLITVDGRVLKSFHLYSIDGGLGNHMLSTYLPRTRTHYLYDETYNRLAVVPRDQPTQLRVLNLRQLSSFRKPQRPTEVRVDFETEMGTQATFYVDVHSGRIRHRVRRAAF